VALASAGWPYRARSRSGGWSVQVVALAMDGIGNPLRMLDCVLDFAGGIAPAAYVCWSSAFSMGGGELAAEARDGPFDAASADCCGISA